VIANENLSLHFAWLSNNAALGLCIVAAPDPSGSVQLAELQIKRGKNDD